MNTDKMDSVKLKNVEEICILNKLAEEKMDYFNHLLMQKVSILAV